jgi:hypothetical protein
VFETVQDYAALQSFDARMVVGSIRTGVFESVGRS